MIRSKDSIIAHIADRLPLRSIRACVDSNLRICLLVATVLSIPGITWGINECWNLDQMGHLKLGEDLLPTHYLKPPLHTYANQIFVFPVVKQVLGGWFHIPRQLHWPYYLLGSRILTLTMYLGFLAAIYNIVRVVSGARVALFATLVLATSSGLLVFNRFLTADAPLLFWMSVSFAFAIRSALRGSTMDAVLAGMLAGLAAANKYNGLGVAIAIPAALFIANGWRFIIRPAPWAAGFAVPVGFILGNPGVVLDTQRFVQDFLYNYLTTPVYDGTTEGTGYFKFLACFPELVGWPCTLLLFLLAPAAIVLALAKKLEKKEFILIWSAFAVFILYYAMIGKFPRMGTRFVLPIIPFVVLMVVPVFSKLNWKSAAPRIIFGIVIAYNIYSSVGSGYRFVLDPRMSAVHWVEKNAPAGSIFENSYAPNWRKIPGAKYKVIDMPAASDQAILFNKIFGDNSVISDGVNKFVARFDESTFTREGLERRSPDYIAFSPQVFDFSGNAQAQRYYAALKNEEFGYKQVFMAAAPKPWPMIYPKNIDFLVDWMAILQKRN